jgi:hypothetical protein
MKQTKEMLIPEAQKLCLISYDRVIDKEGKKNAKIKLAHF